MFPRTWQPPQPLFRVRRWDAKPEVLAWMKGLAGSPVPVSDSIPDQKVVDKWAEDNTLGLIKKMPIEITDDLAVLIASAVAVKISWNQPYKLAEATAEQKEVWAVDNLLKDVKATVKLLRIDGEIWAVHAKTGGAITTFAVLPPAGVNRKDAQVLAEKIAVSLTNHTSEFEKVRLVNLVDEKVDFLTVTKTRSTISSDQFIVTLPAWKAESEFDLIEEVDLGFVDAAGVLGRYDGDTYKASQLPWLHTPVKVSKPQRLQLLV